MAPRLVFSLVAVLAAVSAVAAWRPLFPIVQPTVDSMLGVEEKFNSFLTQYGKNYTGRQYLHRLKVFRDNLVKATLNQVCMPNCGFFPCRFFFDGESPCRLSFLTLVHA